MLGTALEIGRTVRFTYLGSEGQDRFKRVLVLNPLWQSKVHGLDLNRMTPAECETVRAIFDPKTKEDGHRFPLVNDVLRRMDPIEESKTNPFAFYRRFVKPFLHSAGDVYRTYWATKVTNVIVERESTVAVPSNPDPLFKPLGTKPLGTKPLGEGAPLGTRPLGGEPLGGRPLGNGPLFKKS